MKKFITNAVRDRRGDVVEYDYDETMAGSVINALARNNTYVPNIDKIIYTLNSSHTKAVRDADGNLVIDSNTGKPKREVIKIDHPVLTTTVFFTDGTKSVVMNSIHDEIDLDSNGDATDSAKETGLVWAIVKRVCGIPDPLGTVDGKALGRKIHELVKNATDTHRMARLRPAVKAEKASNQAKQHEKAEVRRYERRQKYLEGLRARAAAANKDYLDALNEAEDTIKKNCCKCAEKPHEEKHEDPVTNDTDLQELRRTIADLKALGMSKESMIDMVNGGDGEALPGNALDLISKLFDLSNKASK